MALAILLHASYPSTVIRRILSKYLYDYYVRKEKQGVSLRIVVDLLFIYISYKRKLPTFTQSLRASTYPSKALSP